MLQFPAPIQPGDLLYVIAPSGTLRENERLEKGLEVWRSRGYSLHLDSCYDAQCGYLAGTDDQRREALATAWENPDCKGILCVRGGYGSMRLLEKWSWNRLNSPPKWVIGFSDVTGLLWSLAKAGIGSLHAPVLTTLAAESKESQQRLFDCVEGRPLKALQGEGWGNGKAEGMLLPANLTVATHLLGTPLQPSLKGVILALEDVTEAPYRIDRLLTQWRLSGAFTGVRGIALGRFSQCVAPKGIPSWTVEEVLRDRLSDLNIPIVSNLPFGHNGINAALRVGQSVILDSDSGDLEFLNLLKQNKG